MGSSKKNRRARRLEMFCSSLWRLAPEYKNAFLCPICRKEFCLGDPLGATEAHIIPLAAGGTRTTFLCANCNSVAGKSIDKWFGEAINIDRAGEILGSRYTDGRLKIDGFSVGGRIDASRKDMLRIYIHGGRSNPAEIDKLVEHAKANGIRTLDVKYEILQRKKEVAFGALQAGYLMLVDAFGYVPVFQASMDVVREQLQCVPHPTINSQFMGMLRADIGTHFGIAQIDGKLCLFAAFHRRVCLYPTVGDDTFFENLPTNYSDSRFAIFPFKGEQPFEGLSTALKVGERYVLFPDALKYARRTMALAKLETVDQEIKIVGVAEYGEEL